MKLGKRGILVLVLGLVLIAAFFAWRGTQKTSAETTASIAPVQANATVVEAALVQTRDLDSTISAVGSLRAKESVTLSSEIGGRVDKILFQEGQRVDAGTLLFQLDTSILNASVQSARAANILAQSTFERTEALSKRGISATQALEEAQANLRNTEAALALAEAQLAQTSIKAPFDGVVGLRSVSVGAYVTAGTTNLAKLDQIDPLVAEFTLPEVALANISPQQNVSVVADALPDQPFQGQVYAIEPSVDETGRSIRMRALIANPDLKLRPGLFVRVNVTTGTKADAMLVPESAIVPSGETQTVYRINTDDTVEVVTVTLGQRLEGMVEIVTGLDKEARVVTAGQQKLRTGTKVRVQEATAEEAV
ncbi:efflux RND transporter periplasmic adaptor subunit [Brucella haematophila]|uniref:efflux RND transporter periplasmic adaptor subunit n=1 Tax=Brucella haematophila TaxID=419474 RepID=UPI00110F6895|nr:efflux RND transporter periplasmic adaptor subunit [Brucella haematophila]KAB2698149.1 efflux RND transporter periplasmic adaptor subunit [Ochrobactrum sp. Kaboul]TMV03968.1 efflux RND transporter periplasmic adaptor subunit [Brucella haematophila]